MPQEPVLLPHYEVDRNPEHYRDWLAIFDGRFETIFGYSIECALIDTTITTRLNDFEIGRNACSVNNHSDFNAFITELSFRKYGFLGLQ
jgi:hypothetical protein